MSSFAIGVPCNALSCCCAIFIHRVLYSTSSRAKDPLAVTFAISPFTVIFISIRPLINPFLIINIIIKESIKVPSTVINHLALPTPLPRSIHLSEISPPITMILKPWISISIHSRMPKQSSQQPSLRGTRRKSLHLGRFGHFQVKDILGQLLRHGQGYLALLFTVDGFMGGLTTGVPADAYSLGFALLVHGVFYLSVGCSEDTFAVAFAVLPLRFLFVSVSPFVNPLISLHLIVHKLSLKSIARRIHHLATPMTLKIGA